MDSSTGILTIDLDAIESNWGVVASMLDSGVECAAVVKANAYGVGAHEIASRLYRAGCRTFYLATQEEAVALRRVLPSSTTLYVLGGARAGAEQIFADFELIPVLYSSEAIFRWLDYCQRINRALPCGIKVDTGMTRLGLSESSLEDFLNTVLDNSFLNPCLFISHLACADEPDNFLNAEQLNSFRRAIVKIKRAFPNIKISLANSSGTFLGKDYHFDMVRIGAAIYGINPHPSKKNPLTSTISLKLPVLQIRNLQHSVSVGYGATATAAVGARLAVVAGGYADGLNRTVGLLPKGKVGDIIVDAIGRMSMDSCIFDISRCEGDPKYIEVINEEFTIDRLMSENKTLGYEILTSLGYRYIRNYRSKEI